MEFTLKEEIIDKLNQILESVSLLWQKLFNWSNRNYLVK